MKIFAESERLILRELVPADVDGMFELDSDPEVHKFLGNKPLTSKEQSANVITFVRQQYQEHGIGRWAIVYRETNIFIGWAGLKFVIELNNNHQNYYDIGYRLIRKYWSKGIATEAAFLTLDYAFNTMKLQQVYAAADANNMASIKVLEKIGMQFVETYFDEDTPWNWYKIERSDYTINRQSIR
ncbi:GNAT family N-acetyltransferase [Flavobacterium sp.]|uniref:GNAT family N-acetyltransferase n=1 Tax=Flavobacterium sp. TaxID=239 RepID=UPI003B9BF881